MIEADEMALDMALMLALGALSTPLARVTEREMLVPEGFGLIVAVPLSALAWVGIVWGMM